MMQWRMRPWLLLEQALPWLMLAFLLTYTYAYLFAIPYLGFDILPSGEILHVYVEPPPQAPLQAGDQLLRVGSLEWSLYAAELRRPLLPPLDKGDRLPLQVRRNGQVYEVEWPVAGPSAWAVWDRLVNLWWLAYMFWIAGTITLMLMRPKDVRRRLLIAFFYLTAAWLLLGNLSRWHWWHSAPLLRVAIWLCLPVYLHLHWVFPQSLGSLPAGLVWAGYAIGAGLAALQWLEWLPPATYFLGFLLACVGSMALLCIHFARFPAQRRAAGLIGFSLAGAFTPAILLGLIATQDSGIPWYIAVLLLAMPAIPGAYLYAAYRRQLGEVELRANHLISLYMFLVLWCMVVVILLACLALLIQAPLQTGLVALIVALATGLVTALGFSRFQQWVETRLLGTAQMAGRALEHYAARITTSLNPADLVRLLRDEILAGFLVRQSALLSIDQDRLRAAIYVHNLAGEPAAGARPAQFSAEDERLPVADELPALLGQTGRYREMDATPCAWARLLLPLRLNEEIIGLWLLGRRDPDDFYAQADIQTLQALANQTAIALTNIEQAQQLEVVYQANIDRHESERMRLARTLHDNVLNDLAVLALYAGEPAQLPQFDHVHQTLTGYVRQLVAGLRPTLLQSYGLPSALEELVDMAAARAPRHVRIQLDLPLSEIRYAQSIEQHVYRIVQQGCENALRHADAQRIVIYGHLTPAEIQLVVEDDGVGFEMDGQGSLAEWLAAKHYGLVGMYERATLIGAVLHIDSTPGQGTRVTLTWRREQPADGFE